MNNPIPRFQAPKIQKQTITIRLDIKVVDTFKHLACVEDRSYQTMINKVLRDYIDSLPPEQQYHNR